MELVIEGDVRKIVVGNRDCSHCFARGWLFGRKNCSTCNGTGDRKITKGPRKGKLTHCNNCLGGTVNDFDTQLTCPQCNGNPKLSEPGKLGDSMPAEIWKSLEFRVYRSDRQQTFNEYLLAYDCCYSCTDYGAHKQKTDEELIEDIRSRETSVQASSVTRKDEHNPQVGILCHHVGIFCSDNGYSVRPVYDEDAIVVQAVIACERGKDEGFAVGAALADAGGNGTMGAIYKTDRELQQTFDLGL